MKIKKPISLALITVIVLSNFNICFAEEKISSPLSPYKDDVISEASVSYNLNTIVYPDSVAYPVENGNIYFLKATGGIVGADQSITKANIPNTIDGVPVNSIGNDAFQYCTLLTSITIPNSIKTIKNGAFYNCTSLTDIIIPNSVTSIGNWAFGYCESLTNITIPASVTSIGTNAFLGCNLLTNISVDDENAYFSDIDGVLFNKDNKILKRYPSGKTETNYIIPNNVTTIEEGAFCLSYTLNSVVLPDSITSIGNNAFYYCDSITSINIPNSVTSIGISAFGKCSSLTDITIPDSITSIEDSLFSYCDLLKNITIPNSITFIGDNAFSHCPSLKNITIPDSVTSIGEFAFDGCYALENVILPKNITSIERCTFRDCESLTNITLPNNVTSIGEYAFALCYLLTSITIPDSVTSIEGNAFEDCYLLTNVTLPEYMTSIGHETFAECSSLTSIIIPSGVTYIRSGTFYRCSSLTSITIPSSVTEIHESAFRECDKDKLTLYVEADSYALNYAIVNGYKYVIGKAPTNSNTDNGYSISRYYPQDNIISIGTSGDAKIYFIVNNNGQPVRNENVDYSLTIGDITTTKTGLTDENGLLFAKVNDNTREQDVKIKLLIDETKEHGTCELDYKIVPEELSYTTIFEGSLKAAAKASVGLSKSIGPMELNVATAGVSAGNSKSLSVSYIQNNEQEKNTTDVNVSLSYNPVKVSANGNLGLNAKVGNTSVGYNLVDVKAGAGIIKGYELTLKDYFNKNSANYEKNMIYVILSLVDGALMNSTGMVSVGLTKLNDILMDKVLNDELKENASSKNGYTLDYNAGSGANIKYGNTELSLGAFSAEGVLEFTNEEKGDNSSAKQYKNTAKISDGKFGFGVSSSIGGNKSISTDLADITSVDYEAERSLTAEYNNNNELNKLYYKTEYPTKNHTENLLFLEATKHNSLEYEVDGTLLNKIKNDNTNINEFVTDPLKTTVNGDTIDNFSGILDNYDEYSKYADNISEEKQIKIPISIDVGDGVKLGLDMEIQGKEAESYKTSDGVYNKDGFLETSIYDDYGWTKNYTATSFLKPAEDVIKKFTAGIVDKFNSAVDKAASFVDEVADGLASLSKKINNDLTMTLSVIRDPQRKSSSYNVMSYDGSKKIKLIDGNVADTDIEISKVLSDTYVVNVTDVNGEYVYDFSDSPMILTIPYNDDMVAEAGGIENMAIYKWDGEAGLYEKYNGTVNETEKNITAEIYYSGEYMLCADNTKPSISNFVYDAEDSALKADIKSKLSIIDEETLTLLIDGTEIPDVKNGAYESASGKFTYKLNLDAGTHTAVLSVKDSKGSLSDAAMLTFTVEKGPDNEGLKGDINGDNTVDVTDAVLISRLGIGAIEDNAMLSMSDINNDGYVDITDAVLVARYGIKKINNL